jgi:8-oxo-dGTP diphosphatase
MGVINLRAYGVCRHRGRVLVCEEPFQGRRVTKFPGGGVEFAEGPEDAILREFREELGQDVRLEGHLYTTGFYVPSLRDPEGEKLLSVYYAVRLPDPDAAVGRPVPGAGDLTFRWLPLRGLSEDVFSLPVDRLVARRFLARP